MRGVKKKKSKWEIRGQVKTARRHEGRGEPTPTRMMDEGGGGRRERWGRMERGRNRKRKGPDQNQEVKR